jgi:transposase InsO family protein
VTHFPVTVICQALRVARRTAYYVARARADGRYHRSADPTILEQIRAVTNSRATYGYRRVWAMMNRTFRTGYNRKRIRRVMQLHGLMLAPRVHRRHGRPHLGRIAQPASNQRWCSDVFLIPCWSGEVLSVAFAIDCTPRRRRCSTPTSWAWCRSPRRRTARRATAWPKRSCTHSNGTRRGERAGAAQRLDRGLQHPGAPLGAGDAEPGRAPGGSASKLLAVSRTLGSRPPRDTATEFCVRSP